MRKVASAGGLAWVLCATSFAACTLLGEAELDDKDAPGAAAGAASSVASSAGGGPGGGGAAGGGGAPTGGEGGSIPCEPVDCMQGQYCDQGQCICGSPPAPGLPSGATCPAVCTSCDPSLSLCTIECASTDACKDDTLVCPQGMECQVRCLGEHACEGASMYCPETYSCDVECKNLAACKTAKVFGDTGSLTLDCTAGLMEVCKDVLLTCGDGQCLHPDCAFVDGPTLSCNESCDCEPC